MPDDCGQAFDPTQYRIAELVPHAEPMILLDRVSDWTPDTLTAEVTLHANSPFCQTVDQQQNVPAYVGIEYMAQAIAAHGGICERQKNAAVQIGLLVGSRRYSCTVDAFPLAKLLCVHIRASIRSDAGLCVFDCTIKHGNKLLASASLNVFQPINAEKFLGHQ
jgi:3-oxoacyl-[acyl-carrier-protein] synthase-1